MSANRAMLTVAACLALLVGVLAPSSGAQTEPAPPPLVGGGATPVGSPSPFPDVAFIEMSFPSGPSASCTATLVDPEWLLTAAHCLESDSGLFADDLPLIILGSAAIETDLFNPGPGVEFHQSAGFIIHGDYDPFTFDNDVALVKLTEPSSITPRAIATDTALTEPASDGDSLPARVLGFGGTCALPCASFSTDFLLREGPTTLRTADYARNTIGAGIPDIDDSTIIAVPSTAEAGLCPGDSGGPLFVDDGGTLKVAGVNSHLYFGTGGFCAPFDGSVYVNGFADVVGGLADWVDQVIHAPARTCNGVTATLVGTSYPDKLIGTSDADSIHGLGSADELYGYGSGDRLCGGDAGDLIIGGSGPDQISGNGGHDFINGNGGNDEIDGGGGSDAVFGGGGADTINGGKGPDTLNGNGGNDDISGQGGDDTIAGGQKNDVIRGGKGADTLNGNNGRDTISGNGGNDTIRGGGGADTIAGNVGVDNCIGGAGNDTITTCE